MSFCLLINPTSFLVALKIINNYNYNYNIHVYANNGHI